MGVIRSVFCAVLALALAACATEKDLLLSFFLKKCVAEAGKKQSPVNWNLAKVLNIVIRDGVYDPDETHMKVGEPTILRISNNDDTLRYYFTDEFFDSVALAQVSIGGTVYDRPCISGVSIGAGKEAELRLVPLKSGIYYPQGTPYWFLGLPTARPGYIYVTG